LNKNQTKFGDNASHSHLVENKHTTGARWSLGVSLIKTNLIIKGNWLSSRRMGGVVDLGLKMPSRVFCEQSQSLVCILVE